MSITTPEWCDRYVHDDLNKGEMLELAQLLDGDPEFRIEFVEHLTFDAAIGSALSGQVNTEMLHSDLTRSRSPWMKWGLAAASIIGILSVGWLTLFNGSDLVPATRAVAMLTSTQDTVWNENHTDAEGWMYPGVYRLESGVATITFDSGAVASLTGPAEINLISPAEMDLNRGEAGFYVDEQAQGFRVNTPNANIVDLGTAFSVKVDGESSPTSEVHVVEGEVEVAAEDQGNPTIFRAMEAVKIDAAGVLSSIAYAGDHHLIPQSEAKRPTTLYIYFPMDTPISNSPIFRQRGFRGVDILQQDISAAFRSPLGPEFGTGKYGEALHFDGSGAPTFTFASVPERQRYTLSFWVRIPTDAKPDESTMLEMRNGSNTSERLSVSWNPEKRLGQYGALRIGYQSGYAIGSVPINDGSWHHIAVNVVNGPGTRVATHLRQYVDGHLDEISALRDATMMPSRPGKTMATFIGFKFDSTRPFRGAIDELLIANGPLRPNEIYGLFQSNKLPNGVQAP